MTIAARCVALIAAIALSLSSANAGDTPPDRNFRNKPITGDFSHADLKGADFGGAILTQVSFVGANLRDANFARAASSSVDFTNADFTGADLADAELRNATFVGVKGLSAANLKGAKLRWLWEADLAGAVLSDQDFTGAELYKINLEGAKLDGARFTQAALVGANLAKADLRRANFTQADLRFVNLHGADLTGAVLTEAYAAGADFSDCIGITPEMAHSLIISDQTIFRPAFEFDAQQLFKPTPQEIFEIPSLGHVDVQPYVIAGKDFSHREIHYALLPKDWTGTNFAGSDMSYCWRPDAKAAGANFDQTDLSYAYVAGARFQGAVGTVGIHFAYAHLDRASLSGLNLEKANFVGAYLRNADLTGAKLAGAQFREAQLQGASLDRADLTQADFTGADLTGATLVDAKLANVSLARSFGLASQQVAGAKDLDPQALPAALIPPPPPPAPVLPPGGAPAFEDVELEPFMSRQLKAALGDAALLALPVFIGVLALRIGTQVGRSILRSSHGEATPHFPPPPAGDAPAAPPPPMPRGAPMRLRIGIMLLGLISCLLLAVGAIILCAAYIPLHAQVADSATWTRTPCTITQSELTTNSNGDDADSYSTNISYSFKLAGEDRQGHGFNFGESPSTDRSAKDRIIEQLPVGYQTFCWVDPSQPQRTVLRRSMGDHGPLLHAGTLLMFCGAAGLFIALTAPRRPLAGGPTYSELAARRAADERVGYPAPPIPRAPITFASESARIARFDTALRVVVILGVIAAVAVIASLISPAHFLVFAGVVIGLVALGYLFALIDRTSQLRSPSVRVSFDRPIEPGRAVEVRWSVSGQFMRIASLSFRLEGTEKATYVQGTDTFTDKRMFQRTLFLSAQAPSQIANGQTTLNLPSTTMHTFCAANNRVEWVMIIRSEMAGGSPIEDEIPISIYPTGAV